MEENWVSVFSTRQAYMAEIVKQVLQQNNIISVIINKRDSIYNTIGDIEVYVDRDKLIKAKSIIETIEN